MNDQPKKKNAFDIADDLFANELQKAKQYDELVANLVAGHKIKPNETGDFQAVLSVVANMASAVSNSIDFVRQGPPKLSEMKDAIRKVVAGQTGNSLAIFFEGMVAKLQKVGAIEAGFPAPQQVVDVALAPYLAGWRANDLSGPMMLREDLVDPYAGVLGSIQRKQQEEALVAVQAAQQGDFAKLCALVGRPELASPMKHIIAARKTLANGRVMGGEPLQQMVDAAMKDVDSLARITDTLQHYGQLRSASVVQTIKDICDEYETIWTGLTDKNFNPGDRLKDLVGPLLDKDLESEFFIEQLKDLFREAGLHFEKGHLLNVVERLIASDKAVGKMSAKVRKLKKKLKKAGRLESFGGADVHFGIVDESWKLNNPNHPEVALARIGKALVDAGQLDPEEASRFGECAFAVEVLSGKLKDEESANEAGEHAWKNVAKRLVSAGWLRETQFTEELVLAALEAALQNKQTNVGDLAIAGQQASNAFVELSMVLSPDKLLTIPEIADLVTQLKDGPRAAHIAQLKTATEGLQEIGAMLYEATGGHDDFPGTVQVVAGVKTMLKRAKEQVDNWHEIGGLLYDVKALNSSAPLSLNNVKTAIAELNRRRQSFQQDSDDTAKYLRRCEELLQGFGSGNLEQRIRAVVDSQFKTMGLANQLKDDVEDLASKLSAQVDERANVEDQRDELAVRNNAQKDFIEKVQEIVEEAFNRKSDGTLPDIWSMVRDLGLNYQHAKEADAALEELGSEYVGTLVQKARTAVRVITGLIAQQEAAVARLASAVAKVNGVDLGDPSSDESIEAAILNLGWQRDEARKDAAQYEKTLKEQFVPKERAFANGQRVFVHYFDGCSDEYLGQKAAEVRGAKYVSGTFGWFYMVEFEEAGIGAMNFDYSEDRLALVPEAYLLAGDRVRLRDSQTEGQIGKLYNPKNEKYTVKVEGESIGWKHVGELIPIDQQWSIFSRKGGPRLMTLHAPDKWAAESRAAKRLSAVGKPFVTLSLIAVPGVADNANFGGVTDGVELTIFRKSGHDRNTAFSAMFDGNNVDVNNTIEAVKLILHGNEGGTTPTGERIDKMLPFLRAGSNQLKVDEQVRKDRETTAANPSRKFDDGQAVTGKYLDLSVDEEKEIDGTVASAELGASGWIYRVDLPNRQTSFSEPHLSPRALFQLSQRVIVKSPAYEGKRFAKVLAHTYSDWSKQWSYMVEFTAANVPPSERREADLEAIPDVVNHEALIQQSVQNIVDREEAPAPRYSIGQEVEVGRGLMVWVITGRRWSTKKSTWLYDGKAASGSGTGFGNTPEAEVRPRSGAVVSRFLAATADLQAEADKMVGQSLDVATDAKERAIRDGAVNPDWLNWISGVVGRRFTILSAAVMNDGQVTYKIDSTGFGLGAKYFSYEF